MMIDIPILELIDWIVLVVGGIFSLFCSCQFLILGYTMLKVIITNNMESSFYQRIAVGLLGVTSIGIAFSMIIIVLIIWDII